MSLRDRYRGEPDREPVAPGTIVGVGGDVLSQPGEFNFAEGDPHHDETVYVLWETVQPAPHNRKIGETFAVHLPVGPGWMFCTAKIPGEGNPNDCMLVYLRGTAPPPKGTRFAMRMLRPAETAGDPSLTRGSDATQSPENQGGQTAEDPQGDERVQGREPEIGRERQESDEPEAGDSDRALRERTEQEKAGQKETLGQTLWSARVRNPEANTALDDGLDDYGPDGL